VTRNTEGGSPTSSATAARRPPTHRRDAGSAGVEGNAKLTAMTGAILLVGFAVEGFTILEIHRLLVLHFLVGFLLIGPVLLKIGSTGYRFVRYYTGSVAYVRKGPPAPALRVLGPLVILTSVAVLGTGVILAIVGPGSGAWLFLHKASFILWFAVMTVHVLNYAPRLPRMLMARTSRDARREPLLFAGSARWLALAAAIAVGVGVAALATHLSAQWAVFG
jgi:hypothetical protein